MNIGNSGFEWVVGKAGSSKIGWRSASREGTRYDIRNIKTKNVIFSLWYGRYIGYVKQNTPTVKSDEKKFLGLDDRYYWVKASGCTKPIWGQIQSSGAVIGSDRTIIKQLDFYPIYIIKPTVPVLKPSIPTPSPVILAPSPVPVVEITPVAPVKIDLHKQKLAQILTVKVPVKTVTKPLAMPDTPPVFTGFRDAEAYYIPKEETWLERLIKWIKNLLNLT